MEYIKKIKWSVIIVIAVGYIGIIGKILNSDLIQGLGFITAASPLPLVFSNFRGVEGFASQFYIKYTLNERAETLHVTPHVYDSLKGPYNRRNAIGAAIAGAPMLTAENEKKMVASVLRYSFCRLDLKREFRIPESADVTELIVESKTAGAEKLWNFAVSCHEH